MVPDRFTEMDVLHIITIHLGVVNYDDDDFNSGEMCCICGGGEVSTSIVYACEDDTACNYGEIAECSVCNGGYGL